MQPIKPQILIVDDNDSVLNLIKMVLHQENYEVHATTQPTEALVLMSVLKGVNLLITDMSMPGMTGDILASRVQQSFPSTKVLLISGALPENWDGDMKDYPILHKPFSPQQLIEKTRVILDKGETKTK